MTLRTNNKQCVKPYKNRKKTRNITIAAICLIVIISIFVGIFFVIRHTRNKQNTPRGTQNKQTNPSTTLHIVTVSKSNKKTENDYQELTNEYYSDGYKLLQASYGLNEQRNVLHSIITSYKDKIRKISIDFVIINIKFFSNSISEKNSLLYLTITVSELILERYNVLSELNKQINIIESTDNSIPEVENDDNKLSKPKLYRIILKEKLFLPFYKIFHHQNHVQQFCKPFLCKKTEHFEAFLAAKTESKENWIRAKTFLDFTVFLSLKKIKHNDLNYYIINDIDSINYALIEVIFIVINLYSEIDDDGLVKLNIINIKDINLIKKDNVDINKVEKITQKIEELTTGIIGIIFQDDDKYDLNKALRYTMDLVMQFMELKKLLVSLNEID